MTFTRADRLVDVLFRYSNFEVPEVARGFSGDEAGLDLQEHASMKQSEELRGPARTKVTDRLRREVLARYGAGQSSRQVGAELDLARSTVLGIVGRAGELRPTNRILSKEQVAEARKLRADGWLFRGSRPAAWCVI